MSIFQAYPTTVGLADVAQDDPALDRIPPDEFGHFGINTRYRVMKEPAPPPFIEPYAPAVTMRPGLPAPLHQAGKTEADISGYIGAHPEKFTHISISYTLAKDMYFNLPGLSRKTGKLEADSNYCNFDKH